MPSFATTPATDNRTDTFDNPNQGSSYQPKQSGKKCSYNLSEIQSMTTDFYDLQRL